MTETQDQITARIKKDLADQFLRHFQDGLHSGLFMAQEAVSTVKKEGGDLDLALIDLQHLIDLHPGVVKHETDPA